MEKGKTRGKSGGQGGWRRDDDNKNNNIKECGKGEHSGVTSSLNWESKSCHN
jgi:hypothetical protein